MLQQGGTQGARAEEIYLWKWSVKVERTTATVIYMNSQYVQGGQQTKINNYPLKVETHPDLPKPSLT